MPLALAVAFGLPSCSRACACGAAPTEYAGRVVDDTVTRPGAALSMPSVNLDAGFAPDAAAARSAARGSSAVATAVALTGIGSVARVASVSVTAGRRGPCRATRSRGSTRAALDANVAVAKASPATARAQVGVLERRARYRGVEPVDARDEARADQRRGGAARDHARAARRSARRAEGPAREDRSRAVAGGGRPARCPGRGSCRRAAALPDPAQLRAGIAQAHGGTREDRRRPRSGERRSRASSPRRVRSCADARRQLRDLRVLARVAVDAAKVGVRLAEYQRELAVRALPRRRHGRERRVRG